MIVGGGSAGLRAALAARETGARVLVVNRGGKTYGGATSYLDKLIEVTGLAVALNKEDSDLYYKELYDFGMKVNSRELVRTFTDNSEKELRFLESIGVEFERQGNEYVWMQIPSHSRPRVVKGMSDFGTEILTRLVKACEEKGVQFLAHTGIYEIIKDSSGHPRWALGIHKTQKCTQPVQIRFSSVIIATGGFGNLFFLRDEPSRQRQRNGHRSGFGGCINEPGIHAHSSLIRKPDSRILHDQCAIVSRENLEYGQRTVFLGMGS